MCGFSTYFKYFNDVNSIDFQNIENCNKEMYYRGPDEQGIFQEGNIIMGHVRLSIIGLENGKQPLKNESKTLVLVCNGEIYNYKVLKKKLIYDGFKFKTSSDSEVILYLYEKYKEKCVDFLDGMFAFCLYDKINNTIFCARDRSGLKPLYYTLTTQGVIVSSELKVLKNNFIKNPEYDYEVLRQTQVNGYPISIEKTYIKQIKKLPRGHYLAVNNIDGCRIFEYKKKNVTIKNLEYNEVIKENRKKLFEAVEKRLMSEVPVAILLSAGVDSSVLACISKELGHDVNVICAGYKGRFNQDERKQAKKLSAEKGFNWNEIELDENDFIEYYEEIVPVIDEPVCDASMFVQWGIYKKSKELGFKVLLNGNGADELYYGYENHNQKAKVKLWIKNLKEFFPIKNKKYFLNFMIKKFIEEWNLENLSLINTIDVKMPVENYILNKLNSQNQFLEKEDHYRGFFTCEIDSIYNFLKNIWLPNNCYHIADKLGMANSIEVRSPFSDHNLINFVESVNIKHKISQGTYKGLLKDSMRDIVPDYVLNRKKTGFTPPPTFKNKLINNNLCKSLPQVMTKPFIT